MKLNLTFLYLTLCFFYSGSVSSQHISKNSELTLLSIKNSELYSILDSIISFEKNCGYYSDSLFFTINLRQIKGDSLHVLNIQSNNNMKTAIILAPDGYLYYKEHLFMVYGADNEVFFSKTNKKRKFKYVEYSPNHKKDNVVTVIDILDDSFTIWVYWYIKDHFIFKDKAGSCD
jgi:hypothetical protein